jgi:solute carrier family 20 (sodium-dependent phosphate transporter)
VYKGAPSLKLNKLSKEATAAAIVGTAAVITLLSVLFWLPFVYAKVIKNDYSGFPFFSLAKDCRLKCVAAIRWYHFFFGPLLWFREPPADAGMEGAQSAVPDYRVIKDGPQQESEYHP